MKGGEGMKKTYIRPAIVNSDQERGAFPLAAAAGALAGYAATRAVVNASRVVAMTAKKSLNMGLMNFGNGVQFA